MVHRSFTGALRTFDENYEKNHRKKSRSKRSTSLQAISDLSVVRSQNCSVSDTSMSVTASPTKIPFRDTLLASETPPSTRFTGRLKETPGSSSRKVSRLPLVERKSYLSANVGIFNTIPQKEAMISFRDRLITRRMSDGADQSESGSNDSDDSDSRDEIYDIHRSGTGDSSSTDGELDTAPVEKRKVHSLIPFFLPSPLPPLTLTCTQSSFFSSYSTFIPSYLPSILPSLLYSQYPHHHPPLQNCFRLCGYLF